MGFFAGRLNNRPTMSILNNNNGDISAHITPNEDTIFHSSMPCVLVTEQYEGQLYDAGNGYYVAEMPDQIKNYKSNDANKVILVGIETTQGYRGLLQGFSISTTTTSRFSYNGMNGAGDRAAVSSFGLGSSVTYGTYSYVDSRGHNGSIGFHGTGGLTRLQARGSFNMQGQQNPTYMFNMINNYFGLVAAGSVPLDQGDFRFWNPNAMAPIGAERQGHTHIFVRIGGNVMLSSYGTTPGNWNVLESYSLVNGQDPVRLVTKGSIDEILGNGGAYYNSNNIVPAKYIFYVTNLRVEDSGFSIGWNPFSGNDTLISPRDFTINGVHLPSSGLRFIHQESTDNVGYRPDRDFIGISPRYGEVTPRDSGLNDWGGSNKGTMGLFPGLGGYPNQLSIQSLFATPSWSFNASNLSLSNAYGEVWSPRTIPLRLLPGRAVQAMIGDSINPVKIDGTGIYSHAFGDYNLGFAPKLNTFIVGIEMFAGNINVCGMINHQLQGSPMEGESFLQGRRADNFTEGGRKSYGVYSLYPNQEVVIGTVMARIHNMGNNGSSVGPGNILTTHIILRMTSSGSIQSVVRCWVGLGKVNIFFPKINLTIQRLT